MSFAGWFADYVVSESAVLACRMGVALLVLRLQMMNIDRGVVSSLGMLVVRLQDAEGGGIPGEKRLGD